MAVCKSPMRWQRALQQREKAAGSSGLGRGSSGRRGATTRIYASADVPVIISGAGIAGLASAVALHKVGIPCVVLEEKNARRDEGAAIGLWNNAWRALEALGVAEELRADHLPLGRCVN